jgi:thiamine biosynthesis lipoprotein ApbE
MEFKSDYHSRTSSDYHKLWENIRKKTDNEATDATIEAMLKHCQRLYFDDKEQQMPPPEQLRNPSTLFSQEDIELEKKN